MELPKYRKATEYEDTISVQCLNCKDFFNSDKIPKFCQECGTPFEKEFTKKNPRWDKPRKQIQFSSTLELRYEARNARGLLLGGKFEDNRKSDQYKVYRQWLYNPYLFDDGNSKRTLAEIKYYVTSLRLLSRAVALVRVNPALPPEKSRGSVVRANHWRILKEWKGFNRPEDYYKKYNTGGCSG